MEIAVADMADDGREKAGPLDVVARLGDASGKHGDRHADIGGDDLGAGAQTAHGPIGVMPRLPELGAILEALGPANAPPPSAEAISANVSTCSRALAWVPWNSRNRVGASASVSCE